VVRVGEPARDPGDLILGRQLCGAWFHTLRLSHDFVTSAGPVTTRTGALQPPTRNA
jgi:hypothetical protein